MDDCFIKSGQSESREQKIMKSWLGNLI